MKKLFAVLLCCCTLFAFAACNNGSDHSGTQRPPKRPQYEYDDEKHWIATESGEPEYDGHYLVDNVCTVCGYERKEYLLTVIDEGKWLIYDREDVYEEGDMIKFHTYVHPIPIDMYVNGGFYSSGTRVSINENDDYMEYTLVMPASAVTVSFQTDMIGCSSFLMLYPWLGQIQSADITELIIEQGYVGVSPDTEPTITTYTYRGKISSIREALYDMALYQVTPDSEWAEPVEGGSYIQYTFVTEAERYVIRVENRRLEIDGKIYVVDGTYPVS